MMAGLSFHGNNLIQPVCIHRQRQMPDMRDPHPFQFQLIRLIKGKNEIRRMKETPVKHADQRIVAGPDHVGSSGSITGIGNSGKIVHRKHKIDLCFPQFLRELRRKVRVFIIRNKLPTEFRDMMSQQPKAPDNIRIIIGSPSVDQNIHKLTRSHTAQ